MKYEKPYINFIEFYYDDIITRSGCPRDDSDDEEQKNNNSLILEANCMVDYQKDIYSVDSDNK